MGEFRLHQIQSPDALREMASAWDDLWQRSNVSLPSTRAEIIAERIAYLGASSTFRALVVEHEGKLVAALPLIGRRLKGILEVGCLPCDYWTVGPTLLVDRSVECPALDCLMRGIAALPWPALWLDQVAFEDADWTAVQAAARRAGMATNCREHYRIGQIHIEQNWEAYVKQLKGDHRRKLGRLRRKLEEQGGAELVVHRALAAQTVLDSLRRGFEVEDRGWKGAEGTSVLKNPAVWHYYQREARILAQLGHVELTFLEHRGEPISFAYTWHAKGVCFMPKIGYDEAFTKYAPGQQLMFRMLELYHSEQDRCLLDFTGPYAEFHKMWTRCSYPVGRLVLVKPSLLGRGLFRAYTQWQPRVRRIRQSAEATLRSVRETIRSAFRRSDDSTAPTPS